MPHQDTLIRRFAEPNFEDFEDFSSKDIVRSTMNQYQIRRGGRWENFDSQVNAEIDKARRDGRAFVLVETTTGEIGFVSYVFHVFDLSC